MPVANGTIGALLWAPADDVVLSIDRTDAWDLRDVPEFNSPEFTYRDLLRLRAAGDMASIARIFEKPFHAPVRGKLPLGRLLLGVDRGQIVGTGLDFPTATGSAVLADGTRIEFLAVATAPVGIVRLSGPSAALVASQIAIEAPFGKPPEPLSGTRSALNYGTAADLGFDPPLIFSDDRGKGYAIQTASDGIAVALRTDVRRDSADITWCVTIAPTAATAGRAARILLGRHSTLSSRSRLIADHRQWWSRFWRAVDVRTGDEGRDRRWRLSTYHMGSAARTSASPVPLQAPWTWDNGRLPAWKGDYHHDLNTQMTYWPVYTGNRPEASASFADWLWNTRGECERWTRSFYGVEGLNVPGSADILNRPLGGWAPNSYSLTTGAWLLQHIDLHWRYFQNTSYLRDRAYPYAKGVVTFLRSMFQESGSGTLKLPLSTSPELHENKREAWFEAWTNFDLALCQYAFATAAEMADELNLEAESRAHRAILDQLPGFATDEDGGLSIAPGRSPDDSHRHFSHLAAFYPLGILDAHDEPGRTALNASLARLERLGTANWMGYSFAWLALLYARAGRGDDAARALGTFEQGFSGRNGFHTNGDASGRGITRFPGRLFTLEGGNAAAAAVQEMLLQSHGNSVRLFPAIAKETKSASFRNLRSCQGLDVSAEWRNGKIVSVDLRASRPAHVELFGIGFDGWEIKLKAGETRRVLS